MSMRYGYVSVEGWAALVCWLLTVILTAATIFNLPSESHQTQTVSGKSHAQTAGTATVGRPGRDSRLPRDAGKGPVEPSPPPSLLIGAGIFGLAAIVLTSRWIRNRLWLARARLRAGAWTEGRLEARRNITQRTKRIR